MADRTHIPRLTATRREGARVTPLELFFDLVFVLGVTQCTALMAHDPSWTRLLEGLAVLALLWWAWGGYAWLTSTVDPEEGAVRLVMFGSMAAALVTALCVPRAFEDLDLAFAVAYVVLRATHLLLFAVASRGDALLRRSIAGLAVSSAIGCSLLVAGGFAGGWTRGVLWTLAIVLDVGGPFVFGSEGYRIVAEHFTERFALFMIIALGESVVAIGVGAGETVDAGIVVAAVLGIAIAAALWWLYFDVTSLVAAERLAELPAGRAQNEMARDAWAYLHFPMVGGIVLGAFGLKSTLAHVDDPLGAVPAAALLGGAAMFLLALVGFRLRVVRTLSRPRLIGAVALIALVPLAAELDALVDAAIVAVVCWAVVAYEVWRFAELRDRVRHAHGR